MESSMACHEHALAHIVYIYIYALSDFDGTPPREKHVFTAF